MSPAVRGHQAHLALEHLRVHDLGIDPARPIGTPQMLWCLTTLGICAPDPSKVQLIVSGNVPRSTLARPEGTLLQAPGVCAHGRRGLATSVLCEDERIDVVVPSSRFTRVAAGHGNGRDRDASTQRAIVREGQRIWLVQTGEGMVGGQERGVHGALISSAQFLINEYRVEAAVGPAFLEPDSSAKLVSFIDGFVWNLAQSLIDHREHQDPLRLFQELQGLWCMAWGALVRHLGAQAAACARRPAVLPVAVRQSARWQRVVGDHWSQVARLLASVPPAQVNVSRAVLDAVTRELAYRLSHWLDNLGIEIEDVAQGPPRARLTRLDLFSA